jgi:hypothetical protein
MVFDYFYLGHGIFYKCHEGHGNCSKEMLEKFLLTIKE